MKETWSKASPGLVADFGLVIETAAENAGVEFKGELFSVKSITKLD